MAISTLCAKVALAYVTSWTVPTTVEPRAKTKSVVVVESREDRASQKALALVVERGAWKPSAEEGGSSLTQDWRRLAREEDQCSRASGVLMWCS